jgi:hypothetical protein
MNKRTKIKELIKGNVDFKFGEYHTGLGKSYLLVTILFKGGKVVLDLFHGFADPHQARKVESTLLNSVAKPSLKKNISLFITLDVNDYFLTTRIIKEIAFEKYKETTEYKMKTLYDDEFKNRIDELEKKNG